MCKKLFVLLLLVAFTASMASATIITNVDRTRGCAGDKAPIGVFLTDTDPLPMESGNLKDGNYARSDRTHTWIDTPVSMIGNEFVRTFNEDKDKEAIMVNYAVTIAEAAVVWIAVDDRIPAEYTMNGGVQVFQSQQEAVDLIVHSWAAPGTFVDTTLDLTVREKADGSSDVLMSVYSAQLDAGTYDFGLHPTGKNFYTIGAVPEPATIALLGLGGLALLRRRRS